MSCVAFCATKSQPALSSKVTLPQTDEAASGSLENLLAVISTLHILTLLWLMRVVAETTLMRVWLLGRRVVAIAGSFVVVHQELGAWAPPLFKDLSRATSSSRNS